MSKSKILIIIAALAGATLVLVAVGLTVFYFATRKAPFETTPSLSTPVSPTVSVISATAVYASPTVIAPTMPEVAVLKDETVYYCIYNSNPVLYIHSQANNDVTQVTQEDKEVLDSTLIGHDYLRKDFSRCQTVYEAKTKETVYIENFVYNTDKTKIYTSIINDTTNNNQYPNQVTVYEFNLLDGSARTLTSKILGTTLFGSKGSLRVKQFIAPQYLILSTGPCYGCGAQMDRFLAINTETNSLKLLADRIGDFKINAAKTRIQAKLWVKVGEATECMDECSLYEPIGALQEYLLP